MATLRSRFTLLFLAVTLALVALGCTFGKPLTPQEIDQNGTKSFPAPKAKVFPAAVAALKGEGYEIAYQDLEKGLIKTTPKLLQAVAVGNQATGTFRQYTLRITENGGESKVVATPSVKMGEQDLSAEPVWVIEGPEGERTLWTKLFKEIGELL